MDHLYQGGEPPEGDALTKSGIDVLVLAAVENQEESKYDDIEVIKAPGYDEESEELFNASKGAWFSAADVVVQRIKAGKNVLVTCMMGWNRSGFVNALVLYKLTGWSGTRCVEHIRKIRPNALSNEFFVAYIEEKLKGK